MDEKTRREFILLFNQGFEEIVLPQIEALRRDLERLREETRAGFDRVERRIDDQAKITGNHERRISKLEAKKSTFS